MKNKKAGLQVENKSLFVSSADPCGAEVCPWNACCVCRLQS